MPGLLVAKVEETTLTEGTGTLSLGGATSGNQGFVAAFLNGGKCLYTILDGAGAWEYGLGTVTDATPDTLSRDLVLGSSAGGAKLSLGPGTKLAYCEHPPTSGVNDGYQTFIDGDTTPSVKGGRIFIANNSALTTYTALDDGIAGQEVIIISLNGNAKFNQTSNLHHPSALDITMTANDVICYSTGTGSSWLLMSLSING